MDIHYYYCTSVTSYKQKVCRNNYEGSRCLSPMFLAYTAHVDWLKMLFLPSIYNESLMLQCFNVFYSSSMQQKHRRGELLTKISKEGKVYGDF